MCRGGPGASAQGRHMGLCPYKSPGSESGVTNERESHAPCGTVPVSSIA